MSLPTQRELKEELKSEIPDDPVPVQEIAQIPLINDGYKYVYVGMVKKYEVWKKETFRGAVFAILLLLSSTYSLVKNTVSIGVYGYQYAAPYIAEAEKHIGKEGDQFYAFLVPSSSPSSPQSPRHDSLMFRTNYGSISPGTTLITGSFSWGTGLPPNSDPA